MDIADQIATRVGERLMEVGIIGSASHWSRLREEVADVVRAEWTDPVEAVVDKIAAYVRNNDRERSRDPLTRVLIGRTLFDLAREVDLIREVESRLADRGSEIDLDLDYDGNPIAEARGE